MGRAASKLFVDTWLEASPNDPIHKSNVSRWINNKAWPKDSAKFLRLSTLLDVDPGLSVVVVPCPAALTVQIRIRVIDQRRVARDEPQTVSEKEKQVDPN